MQEEYFKENDAVNNLISKRAEKSCVGDGGQECWISGLDWRVEINNRRKRCQNKTIRRHID